MVQANHRFIALVAVVFLCIQINGSNRSKRCTENQIGNLGTYNAGNYSLANTATNIIVYAILPTLWVI